MPLADVVKRYHRHNITTYTTPNSGMVRINLNVQGIDVDEYRQDLWPYWFAN